MNGANQAEVISNRQSPTFIAISKQPTNAPYYVVRNLARKVIPHRQLTVNRAVSATVGFLVAAAFFGLMSLWYRPRVAVLSTVMFAASSWFFRTARLGTPDIMLALPIVVILFWAWLQRTQKQLAFLLASVSAVLLLYVPAMAFVVLPAVVWQSRFIIKQLRKLSTYTVIISLLIGLLSLSPLVYGLLRETSNVHLILGINPSITLISSLKVAARALEHIFIRSPMDASISVGRVPLLDVFTSAMVVLGLYECLRNWRLDRNKLSLGLLIVGMATVVIGGGATYVPLIIPVYLLAAAGVAYLLEEWLRVFPRNPLARNTAMILVSVVVLLVAFYHVSNYFLAWPNAPATKATFSQRL